MNQQLYLTKTWTPTSPSPPSAPLPSPSPWRHLPALPPVHAQRRHLDHGGVKKPVAGNFTLCSRFNTRIWGQVFPWHCPPFPPWLLQLRADLPVLTTCHMCPSPSDFKQTYLPQCK